MSPRALRFLVSWFAILLASTTSAQEYSPHGNLLTRLTIRDVPITAEVVSTPEKHYLGLSHRQALAEGLGMLFVMETEDRHGFCMRDMLFSIDILWIADGKVAGIHSRLSPSDQETFISPVPVRLVLEVPGGFAQRHGIKVGDPVTLQLSGLGAQTKLPSKK